MNLQLRFRISWKMKHKTKRMVKRCRVSKKNEPNMKQQLLILLNSKKKKIRRLNEAKAEEDRVLQQMVQDEMNRRETKRKSKLPEVPKVPVTDSTPNGIVKFDRLINYQDGGNSITFSAIRGVEGFKKGDVTDVYTARP